MSSRRCGTVTGSKVFRPRPARLRHAGRRRGAIGGIAAGLSLRWGWQATCRQRPRRRLRDNARPRTWTVGTAWGERSPGVALAPSALAGRRVDPPDLVVGEPAALAAPLAARRAGVPYVAHEFGLPLPTQLLERAAEAMSPAWREAGLDVGADAGVYAGTVVRIVPPRLADAGPASPPAPRVLWQRPSSVSGVPGAPLPHTLVEFLRRHDRGPLLYVSFGTLHPAVSPRQSLLAALRKLPVACIVTSGPDNPPPVDLPAHWWSGRYVPQSEVLPYCSAVISHGGAGTALGAAALGLPQLCLPQGADQFRNAEALLACGRALTLEPPFDAKALTDAIDRLLSDTPLRAGAGALGSAFERLPAPAATVAALAGADARP